MQIRKWLVQHSASYDEQLSLTAQLLQQRGYADDACRNKFLAPTIGDLYDPFLLLGMAATVKRIKQAIKQRQKITIYGDYDVDGMTSTAILYRLIVHLGGQVDYYIPQRLQEGYGINGEAIKTIAAAGSQLIISVDCGITALEEAELAKELAVDLIISDHHSVPATLPDAYAIINPKQVDCHYPFEQLAGAGVALKIAQAFLAPQDELFKSLLVLSAVGTIADIMPLTDENRLIAHFGLQYFWSTANLGLQALASVGGLAGKAVSAGQVGFVIGPRLNAVGRLDDAKKGVALLLSDDQSETKRLAAELNQLNLQRQNTESEILAEALQAISTNRQHLASGTIIVWGDDWHSGVIGIVASRLVERYYRPCIVLSRSEGVLKGSARSIAGYSIYDALAAQRDLLEKFGGHRQAAGLTLKAANLDALIEGLTRYNAVHLTADLLFAQLKIDDYIKAAQINHITIDQIDQMQPFGVGNARPTFALDGVMVEQARRIGKANNHLKMVVNASDKLLDVIQFNYATEDVLPYYHCRVDCAFTLALNHFNGVESIQLNQQDMRIYSPLANEFNKRCYAVYCDALVDHILNGQDVQAYRPIELRNNLTIGRWLADDRPVAIFSYEALQAYAYACFDRNSDWYSHIASGKLKLLPAKIAVTDIVADRPLFASGPSDKCYSHPLDNSQLLTEIGDIFFDRQVFSALYKKIRHQNRIDVIELLMDSTDILLDRVALAFFEEAGFIVRQAGQIVMTSGVHQKYNFGASQIQRSFDRFKVALYRIVTEQQTAMP